MSDSSSPITQLLSRARQGDEQARAELWERVYHELRRVAYAQMACEPPGRTLQPTALVHETFLRLSGAEGVGLKNRVQFFAAAAKVMRRIRVDDARMRRRLKRGGGAARRSLDGTGADAVACFDDDPLEILAIEENIRRLEQVDARAAEVFVNRFYGGMTREDISEAVGIAPRTVDKLWAFARAYIGRQLRGERES